MIDRACRLFVALSMCLALAACGSSTSVQECEVDSDCDDGVACTTETCNAGSCVRNSDDAQCDDGVFCNGAEVCAPFAGCVLSEVPACDDGVDCTADSCDEVNQRCVNTPADSLCDDGLWCNGTETCDATNGCQSGTAPNCDDGMTCTTDTCDEARRACVNTAGVETCDGVDNDCDGEVDEGVLSACGTCDTTCEQSGGGGVELLDDDVVGLAYDIVEGGLSAQTVLGPNNLWLPNTNESTLSRWDPTAGTEVARYRVGLASGECLNTCCWGSGCNMPSRVAVDSRGDAYIASRGFDMQGSVTKVFADSADCIDRNMSGSIETSTNSTPLAYDADECVAWTANVGPVNAVLRALTIDRGDVNNPEGYIWVGGYNTQQMYKVHPKTGAVLQSVNVAPIHPYGAVVVGTTLWVSALDDNRIAFFDTTEATPTVTQVPFPAWRACSQSYGVTADASGRIWLSGWGCQDALGYDPALGQWTRITGFGNLTGRGITADSQGRIWMPRGGDGQSSLTWWNASAFNPGGTIPLTEVTSIAMPTGHNGPSAVGEDLDGYIWLGHHVTSQLVRVDPQQTGSLVTLMGANRVYTYSDFTGSVRRTVMGVGYYRDTQAASCVTPTLGNLTWDATTPNDSTVTFYLTVAASAAELDDPAASDTVLLGSAADTSPLDIAAVLAGAGVTAQQFIRLGAVVDRGTSASPPVLRDIALQWFCP